MFALGHHAAMGSSLELPIELDNAVASAPAAAAIAARASVDAGAGAGVAAGASLAPMAGPGLADSQGARRKRTRAQAGLDPLAQAQEASQVIGFSMPDVGGPAVRQPGSQHGRRRTKLYQHLNLLLEMLPHVDHRFLAEKLQLLGGSQDPEAVSLVLDAVAELGDKVPLAPNTQLSQPRNQDDDDPTQTAAQSQTAANATSQMECGCCFAECSWKNITACEDGHLFCFDCARRTFEAGMGLQKTNIKCPDIGGCEYTFPTAELKRFLSKKTFDGYMLMCQQVDLRDAQIDGFERCPFCDYGISFELAPDQEPLFRCQSDSCGVVSCRKCRKKAHALDVSCQEGEKLSAAHELAEAMTAALLRECPKCHNKFMKEDGCNKMTCPCGQFVCYVCKKGIAGYDHFNDNGGCPLWDDSVKRNQQDVERARREAAEQLRQEHAEVDIDTIEKQLAHDPQGNRQAPQQPGPGFGGPAGLPLFAAPAAPRRQPHARRPRGRQPAARGGARGRGRGRGRANPPPPPPPPPPPAPAPAEPAGRPARKRQRRR